jgi:hypothetical protein
MSIEALSWAFNLDLPSSGAKLTLLALANYSNEQGEAFPSQKAMSIKTCLCERAIRTHLVTLEDLGIVSRVARTRANGSFTTDLFKLNIGAVASGKICQRQNLPTAENDISQRQILPNPAAESAGPYPSLTTTVTKSNQKTDAPATRLPADWKPSEIEIEFCKTKRPDLNPFDVADGFVDYWLAVPGAKGKKADWPATWRNWIRNQRQTQTTHKGQTRHEQLADKLADLTGSNRRNQSSNQGIIHGTAERLD